VALLIFLQNRPTFPHPGLAKRKAHRASLPRCKGTSHRPRFQSHYPTPLGHFCCASFPSGLSDRGSSRLVTNVGQHQQQHNNTLDGGRLYLRSSQRCVGVLLLTQQLSPPDLSEILLQTILCTEHSSDFVFSPPPTSVAHPRYLSSTFE
jgi:hypothetical protein